MSCRVLRGLPARLPVALEWGFGGMGNDGAKIHIFYDMVEK